jgi:hypothetical protein
MMAEVKKQLEELMRRKEELDVLMTGAAVHGAEIDPSLIKEYEQLSAQLSANSPLLAPDQIKLGYGAIDTITLPPGWIREKDVTQLSSRRIDIFHLEDNKNVELVSEYRDLDLPRDVANAFQDTLYSKFHDLTAREIQTLDDVLEELAKPDWFEIKAAYVNYLNNRRVLHVDGIWQGSDMPSTSVFADVGGKGRRLHVLRITAPEAVFPELTSQIAAIFTSIIWIS